MNNFTIDFSQPPFNLLTDAQRRFVSVMVENPDFTKKAAAEHIGLTPDYVYRWGAHVDEAIAIARNARFATGALKSEELHNERLRTAVLEQTVMQKALQVLFDRLDIASELFDERDLLATIRRVYRSMSDIAIDDDESNEGKRQVSPKRRWLVLSRDNFTCYYCGAKGTDGVELHVDHVVPYSLGGATDYSNLMAACQECNAGKSDILLSESQQLKILSDIHERNQNYGID